MANETCGCGRTMCPNCDGAGSYSTSRGVSSCGHCEGIGYICNASTCRLPAAIAAIQKKLKNPYLKPGVALGLQMALRALGVEGGDRG